jgi:hypothetical protein
MMEKYKRILDKQIDKVEADPASDPENLKIIDRMMRTVQAYDRAQERKEERKEAMELLRPQNAWQRRNLASPRLRTSTTPH